MASRKKNPLPYAEEIGWAETICAPFGCVVARSLHQFEVATVKGEDVRLVIYPHRSTAGHYHLRVRDNGSKNKARAAGVMRAMDRGEGLPPTESDRVHFSCTFSVKNKDHG